MEKELIEINYNGNIINVYKLHGDGQCSCYGCEQDHGWNRIWTDMCYEYEGKIYCGGCLKKLLKTIYK